MKSTLFIKFIILYIILGFLSFFTVSAFSYTIMDQYVESDLADEMYQDANLISSKYLPDYFSEKVDAYDVKLQLKGMSSYLNSVIWLVDREGTVLSSAGIDRYPYAPSKIENFDPLEGKNSTYFIGNYHNLFSEDMMTVIAPVTKDLNLKGYLIIHKPYQDVKEKQSELFHQICLITLFVYLLSFIILIGIQFLVLRPLSKVTDAAKQYASGNLDVVIPVNTQDEMGYLSASLNYMAVQLKDMKDYQKKFIANVSHDFRSPLTSIKGYVQAMSDGTIPPEMQGKYLNIILFETDRLTGLTQDLLTLNEFDTKNLLLSMSYFDIHEVIRNTVATFEGTCTAKKISIELILATRQLFVYADSRKVQQILYNLIDNAIKFSNPDSIITIETTERGDKVFTSVKDNGIGIPKQSIGKIWERFYKSDLSRGKDKKGTGLGLSIVKEIVQAHNENISVISTEGVGTEFVFSLSRTKP